MNIKELATLATDKDSFRSSKSFTDFAKRYLDVIDDGSDVQATIVAKGKQKYRFIQYGDRAGYRTTRAINSELFYTGEDFANAVSDFEGAFDAISNDAQPDENARRAVQRVIYTAQQSIGAALDAHPVANVAKKVNGDLFEKFMNLLVTEVGYECRSGVLRVPYNDTAGTSHTMNYQHDMLLSTDGELKAIGSVKTSSKDRFAKVFLDRMIYDRLTNTNLPHVAIFLNDVQRTGALPNYGIGNTFLPGHYRGYSVALGNLDGVYYCDPLDMMKTDPYFSQTINTIDKFFYDDLQTFIQKPGKPIAAGEIVDEEL